mmetsp:Transcript_117755/g.375392  ORF Transcript_117755/g.375392 Transcript_117755/m.375392 type:complete len:252 (-) Transcript_117755:108-863(-)
MGRRFEHRKANGAQIDQSARCRAAPRCKVCVHSTSAAMRLRAFTVHRSCGGCCAEMHVQNWHAASPATGFLAPPAASADQSGEVLAAFDIHAELQALRAQMLRQHLLPFPGRLKWQPGDRRSLGRLGLLLGGGALAGALGQELGPGNRHLRQPGRLLLIHFNDSKLVKLEAELRFQIDLEQAHPTCTGLPAEPSAEGPVFGHISKRLALVLACGRHLSCQVNGRLVLLRTLTRRCRGGWRFWLSRLGRCRQ